MAAQLRAPRQALIAATCSANYSSGTSVVLTATAASGSTFAGWSGTGCTTGTVAISANTSCTAAFNNNQQGTTPPPTTTIARNECANPPAGTVFCADFEGTNPKAAFDDYDGNLDTENPVIADTGPSNDGANKAVRFRAPAGQSGGADLVKVLSSGYDKLYARWYLKYETGFNFSAGNHGGGLAAGDRNFIGSSGNQPNGSDFAGSYLQYQNDTAQPFAYSYYRGMYQDCGAQGSCWGDSLPCVYDTGGNYCTKSQDRPSAPLPNFQAGQWYCVEQMVDMELRPPQLHLQTAGLRFGWMASNMLIFRIYGIRTTASLKLQSLWLNLYQGARHPPWLVN